MQMISVEFEKIEAVDDALLEYAVIVSRYNNKWVYCKHKDRETWEIPGGHREPRELITDTAKRELYEETGAADYVISPVCVYCVNRGSKSYGLLCYADIKSLGALPASEIDHINLFDSMPESLTYPEIQPFLFDKINHWLKNK